MLNIERRVDVDAVAQKLLDVHTALGMSAAADIGVSEFIDECQSRVPREQSVEVHLLEPTILVLKAMARDDLQPLDQRFSFRAPVRLDKADDHIDAFLPSGARLLQHLIGLADPWGGAEEDLELTGVAIFFSRRFKECIRRGALF